MERLQAWQQQQPLLLAWLCSEAGVAWLQACSSVGAAAGQAVRGLAAGASGAACRCRLRPLLPAAHTLPLVGAAIPIGLQVNINPAYRAAELAYALNQAGVTTLVLAPGLRGSREFIATVGQVADQTQLRHRILIGGDAPEGERGAVGAVVQRRRWGGAGGGSGVGANWRGSQ